MLETHTTDDILAETDAKIRRFTQLFNKTPIQYAEFLRAKALRCERVYDEYVLRSNFIESV